MALAAAPAFAADTTLVLTPTPTGGTADFGNTVTGTATDTFTDNYFFDVSSMGSVGAAVITISMGSSSLTLNSVFLNGTALTIVPVGPSFAAQGTVSTITNPQTLTINGTGAGSYGGNVVFTAVTSAVPEPASWAMMIAGFGLVGAAARMRKARVSYAV